MKDTELKTIVHSTGRNIYKSRITYTERGKFLQNRDRYEYTSSSILKVVMMCMFIIMYFQVVFGRGTGFTFTGFLNALASAPSIPIDWMTKLTSFRVDIPIIGALVNFMVGVISVAVYLSVGISQLVVYVGYILGFLTGVV